jgi:DNA-binding CsgD family transcriptional regulator
MCAKTSVTALMLKREDFRRLMKKFWSDTWNILQLILRRVKYVVESQIQDKHERELKMETLRNYFLGRVIRLEEERDTLREVLDRLPTAILLVDKDKKVILMNKSARIVIAQGNAFILKRNEIHAVIASDNRKFQELIRNASSNLKGAQEESGGALIVSRNSQSPSLPVIISPLRSREYSLENQTAAAVIFISDPELSIPGPHEILRKLYGLTATEARLSSALLQGRNVMQIAGEHKIKVNTVRGHLKSIFLKTGANSQSDLVRILLISPRIAS